MLKKTMKNKGYFLLGVFLLFALLPMISGAGYDWTQYGNGYSSAHQSQYEDSSSLFDEGVFTLTSTYTGLNQFSHPTQVIVDEFGDIDTNYLAVTSGNYLRFFDSDFNFYTEYFVGMSSMGQMGSIDWDDDGKTDIVGFWRENSTQLHFKVLSLNHTNNLVSEIYNYNFSYSATNGVSGVRCSSNNCYALLYNDNGGGYDWTSFQINSTGIIAHLLYSTSDIPIEPPSFNDYNNDGVLDFLVFSDSQVSVYNELGSVLANWTFPRGAGKNEYVKSAKFFNGDVSPQLRVAIVVEVPNQYASDEVCSSNSCVIVYGANIQDGTGLFTTKCLDVVPDYITRLQGFAIRDYNNDGYDDIWCSASNIDWNNPSQRKGVLKIIDGEGNFLYSSSSLGVDYGASYPSSSMTLARMDDDSVFDAIIYADGRIRVWSPSKNGMIYSANLNVTTAQGSCIPADLTYDGYLDLVCADANSLELLSSNVTNQNAYITQVAYDPSTLVAVNQTLTAIVTAEDQENNYILYAHKCNSTADWGVEDGSNTKSCIYNAVGTYVLTIGVRDAFHQSYVTFPQTIIVTSTGAICDNDYVCEAGQGETYLSCSNDCQAPSQEEFPNSTTATGGTPLPTTLVDVNNINHGLLPEIYYGTLGFMSSIISPTILVVFVIFFALIMITIGGIIRKIAQKVSESGR